MDPFRLPYQCRDLKEALLKTLAFFDVFDYPLTDQEIHQYLLHYSSSFEKISSALRLSHFANEKDGYFFLQGRDEIVEIRKYREKMSSKWWKKVRKFSFLFRLVPFVKMIAVCNRLSYNNADESSDIDLFVVAKSNRLFFVRTCLMFLLALFGVRLSGKKEAGKFCLSFLVSEDAMDLAPLQEKPYDIYLAYWFATLKPLIGRDTYEVFLQKNEWIIKFFPRGIVAHLNTFAREESFFRRLFERIFVGELGDNIEKKLADWQLKRALQKWNQMDRPHGVVIRKDILKFHENDRRAEFRERWEYISRDF